MKYLRTMISGGRYRAVSQNEKNEAADYELKSMDSHHTGIVRGTTTRRTRRIRCYVFLLLGIVTLAIVIGCVVYGTRTTNLSNTEGDNEVVESPASSPTSLEPHMQGPDVHHLPNTPEDHLAATPPMGWNSWNIFDCDGYDETVIKNIAKALVNTGLAEAGYIYVNLDDCWQLKRNSSGYIQPDPAKFPKGEQSMKELGQFLHERNLKFGIYTDRGTLTCQRRPGSYGHEEKDAVSYASWGVDFLKNDDCYIKPRMGKSNAGEVAFKDYRNMRMALDNTGRNIIHSIKGSVPIDKASEVGEMRRAGSDIWMSWGSMLSLIDVTVKESIQEYTGPGFWNDLDMLEVGNPGMSHDEQIAHFSLWCAFKAPLLLGNDVSSIDSFALTLLKHKGLIDINQDPLGKSVKLIWSDKIPKGGSADTLIVTDPCNKSDSNQVWYNAGKHVHLGHGRETALLLTAAPNDLSSDDSYISVTPFENDSDKSQWWFKDDNNNRLLSLRKTNGSLPSNECLIISKYDDVYARLRPCDAKSRIYDNMWVPWDSRLTFEPLKDNYFLIKNSKNKCLASAALPELVIYAGPLSGNRIVVVLLNRDFQPRTLTVSWTDLEEFNIDKDGAYDIEDVYTGKKTLNVRKSKEFEVKPHYTVTLILTPTIVQQF